jgi:hypothetical protein
MQRRYPLSNGFVFPTLIWTKRHIMRQYHACQPGLRHWNQCISVKCMHATLTVLVCLSIRMCGRQTTRHVPPYRRRGSEGSICSNTVDTCVCICRIPLCTGRTHTGCVNTGGAENPAYYHKQPVVPTHAAGTLDTSRNTYSAMLLPEAPACPPVCGCNAALYVLFLQSQLLFNSPLKLQSLHVWRGALPRCCL